jgi:hypothetical protein
MDVVNPALCTTWKEGNMDATTNSDGIVLPYHQYGSCPYEDTEGVVRMTWITCCGARGMRMHEKLLAVGLVGFDGQYGGYSQDVPHSHQRTFFWSKDWSR